MTDPVSIGTTIFKAAVTLKKVIEGLAENEKSCYKLASELIEQIQEIENIRKGHVSNYMAGLDESLARLENDLETVVRGCEKLVKKKASIWKRLNKATRVSQVKENIRELKEKVRDAKMSYLLRNQADMSIKQYSIEANIQIGFTELTEGLRAHLTVVEKEQGNVEANPIVNPPSVRRKKLSLRKSTRKRSAADEDLEIKLIQLKIRTLEKALEESPALFEITEIAKNWKPLLSRVYRRDYSNLQKDREDVLIESMTLLQVISGEADPPENTPAITCYFRASSLSDSLHFLGLHEEALQMRLIGHKIIERLFELNEEFFRSDLATSTYFLSSSLNRLGKHEEALVRIQDAVRLQREVSNQLSSTYNIDDTARTLHGLASCLINVGRTEEALKYAEETVQLYRDLTEQDPTTFSDDLALALHNKSICFREMGKCEEATEDAQNAVRLLRKLAEQDPGIFLAYLASSLQLLSSALSGLERTKDAAERAQESVQTRRELVDYNRRLFLPGLASSLFDLSDHLSDTGREEEALESIQEAVQLYEGLAEKDPTVYTDRLVSSLQVLATCLRAHEKRREALKCIQRVVRMRRIQVQRNPGVYIPRLAASLSLLCKCLTQLGRQGEALATIQEAEELSRGLVQQNSAYLGLRAVILRSMSVCLYNEENFKKAFEYIQEAIQINRKLVVEDPRQNTPDLASSCQRLSNMIRDRHEWTDYPEETLEAIKLLKKPVNRDENFFRPFSPSNMYAIRLNDLRDIGRRKVAMSYIDEALQLYRELAKQDPGRFSALLARCLQDKAEHLSITPWERRDALELVQEAVKLLRVEVTIKRRYTYKPELALSLYNLALQWLGISDYTEALSAIQESLEIYEAVAEEHPDYFESELIRTLSVLSRCLRGLGRIEEEDQVWIRCNELRMKKPNTTSNLADGDVGSDDS